MPIASKVLAWEYDNSLKQLNIKIYCPIWISEILYRITNCIFWNKSKKLSGSKMSAESEFTPDKEGFLECKDCSRRFLTAIGFLSHSC